MAGACSAPTPRVGVGAIRALVYVALRRYPERRDASEVVAEVRRRGTDYAPSTEVVPEGIRRRTACVGRLRGHGCRSSGRLGCGSSRWYGCWWRSRSQSLCDGGWLRHVAGRGRRRHGGSTSAPNEHERPDCHSGQDESLHGRQYVPAIDLMPELAQMRASRVVLELANSSSLNTPPSRSCASLANCPGTSSGAAGVWTAFGCCAR